MPTEKRPVVTFLKSLAKVWDAMESAFSNLVFIGWVFSPMFLWEHMSIHQRGLWSGLGLGLVAGRRMERMIKAYSDEEAKEEKELFG